jgi:wyosine [tRNA(Phe)-imidazoG37] synthetase (radical SAM superfamily)
VRGLFPTIEQIEKALIRILKEQPDVDRITFSGNGEPTLHPEFEYIAEMTFKLRNLYLPDTCIALFTNGSLFSKENIRRALSFIDEPFLKIDASSEKQFQQVNRPAANISFRQIIDFSREIPNLSIQSMFLDGIISNITENSIEQYFQIIRYLNPVKVHIYSIDRPVPTKNLQIVPEEVLRQIAEEGQRRTGIPFKYFV